MKLRRSSLITILILVAIIVILTIALIVTNLPKKGSNVPEENGTEVEQNVGQEEEPTYVSLDSDIIVKMYKTVSMDKIYSNDYSRPTVLSDLEYTEIVYRSCMATGVFDTDVLNQFTISDAVEMQYEELHDGMRNTVTFKSTVAIPEEIIKNAVEKTFGKECKFENQNLKAGDITLAVYDESTQKYYLTPDGGNGMLNSIPLHAIIEVKEYSDRYEVTEKYVLQELVNDSEVGKETYNIKAGPSDSAKVLEAGKTIDEVVNGITAKPMYAGLNQEIASKVITKYYDDASEYVHTFMKNEDGTFYWVKSEKEK